MLFLGHFVVVNWSEQLAVMQVMELLFSFHLRRSCVCGCVRVCVGVKVKGRPSCILERGTTGGNTARWWPERWKHRVGAHGEGMCTGVSRFFKRLPPPFTFAAANPGGGISAKLKYFSGRMLPNVLYTNTASYSGCSGGKRKCPSLSYSNRSFPAFPCSTKSCALNNKIAANYCMLAVWVHLTHKAISVFALRRNNTNLKNTLTKTKTCKIQLKKKKKQYKLFS